MAVLGRAMYDPAVANGSSTSAVSAMTALDTTNLRVTFTVPASGNVFVVARGVINSTSIAAVPQFLVGVLQGSTVMGRVAPRQQYSGVISTATLINWSASFVVTGLTPAAVLTWDIAVGVETAVSPSTISRGGPNDTSGANAWGACSFEIRGV